MHRWTVTETRHYPEADAPVKHAPRWIDAPNAAAVMDIYRSRHGSPVAADSPTGKQAREFFDVENGNNPYRLEVRVELQPDGVGHGMQPLYKAPEAQADELAPYRVEIKEATKDADGNPIHPQVSVRAYGYTIERTTADAGEMYRHALAEVGRSAPSRLAANTGPGA